MTTKPPPSSKAGSLFRDTVRLMRIEQWTKNAFVLAVPLFGQGLFDVDIRVNALLAFMSFCFASSGVYILNDLLDRKRDREHPEKRLRPLASGRLSGRYAVGLAAVLVTTSYGLSVATNAPMLLGVLSTYIIANVLYSIALKHVVIVEVGFIALGFILRVMAGSYATGIPASYWLLLCTLNLSLFLGFAKRRAEFLVLKETAHNHRRVLQHYSERFLDQVISVVTTTTLVTYMLYTVDERTVEAFGHRGLALTIPIVMFGLFRYLYVAYHLRKAGDPSRVLLSDWPLLFTAFLWAAMCALFVYRGNDVMAWLAV